MVGDRGEAGQWLSTTGTSASLEAPVADIGDGEPLARGGDATVQPR